MPCCWGHSLVIFNHYFQYFMSVNSKGQSLIDGREAQWLERSFFNHQVSGLLKCPQADNQYQLRDSFSSLEKEFLYWNDLLNMIKCCDSTKMISIYYICVLQQGWHTKWVSTCPHVSIYGFGSFLSSSQACSKKVVDLDSSWFVVETLTNDPNCFCWRL